MRASWFMLEGDLNITHPDLFSTDVVTAFGFTASPLMITLPSSTSNPFHLRLPANVLTPGATYTFVVAAYSSADTSRFLTDTLTVQATYPSMSLSFTPARQLVALSTAEVSFTASLRYVSNAAAATATLTCVSGAEACAYAVGNATISPLQLASQGFGGSYTVSLPGAGCGSGQR